MSHGRICPIFAPVIRQVKSGCGHYSSFKQVVTIMKQAAKKQLLNAQKVDGAIISEENGTIAFPRRHGTMPRLSANSLR